MDIIIATISVGIIASAVYYIFKNIPPSGGVGGKIA